MKKNEKILDLDKVRENWDYLDDKQFEKDTILIPQVMGSFGVVAGTAIAGLGGISVAAENPAGIGVVKTGVGIAAVGAGALTIGELSDELIYKTGKANDENAESTKNNLLPFSKRRAQKYKNTENIVQSIAEGLENNPISNLIKNSNKDDHKKAPLDRDHM